MSSEERIDGKSASRQNSECRRQESLGKRVACSGRIVNEWSNQQIFFRIETGGFLNGAHARDSVSIPQLLSSERKSGTGQMSRAVSS